MSGCLKTSVEYGAKLFRLPVTDSRQGGLCSAWKARGVSVKEVKGRKPRGLATSWWQGGPKALSPGGWGGSQRVAFCSVKVPIFFAGQPWPDMAWGLSGRKPASQPQARWMSRLCVWQTLCGRLGCSRKNPHPLTEDVDFFWNDPLKEKILCIFWEKCQGGCVDINTIFKNPDIKLSNCIVL